MYAANQERLASSVVRQIMSSVRNNPTLTEALGESVRFEPVWWLNGDPYINGAVRLTYFAHALDVKLNSHLTASEDPPHAGKCRPQLPDQGP